MSGAREWLCAWAVVCFLFRTPHSGNSHLVGLRTFVLSREGQSQANWDRESLDGSLDGPRLPDSLTPAHEAWEALFPSSPPFGLWAPRGQPCAFQPVLVTFSWLPLHPAP